MAKSFKMPSVWKLIVAVLICEMVGLVSALLAMPGMSGWFQTINKPSWNPPAYLFAPVWTFLYLFMGIAWWLIWKADKPIGAKKNALAIFALQLFLNFWWSILFFRFHSPLLALVDIAGMIVAIIFTIILFAPISRIASWLLVPYILWVCFAAVLNYTIWLLNT